MQFRQLQRREFINLLGGAATWPLAARAQQGAGIKRLGILMAYPEGDQEGQAFLAAFREEFDKLGWMEAMSRILLKWAERSLPSMLLRDFQLFVKNSVMQLV